MWWKIYPTTAAKTNTSLSGHFNVFRRPADGGASQFLAKSAYGVFSKPPHTRSCHSERSEESSVMLASGCPAGSFAWLRMTNWV